MIVRDLASKQDFKQFLRLVQRKLIGRATSDSEKIEFRRINYRLVRICDFLLADLQQFSLEELQDLCKIYEMADVVHDQFYDGRKTEDREEYELEMLKNCLQQTEMILQNIFGYEPDCDSPSDKMMRNRLQLTRMIISANDLSETIANKIEDVKTNPELYNYEKTCLEMNFSSLLTTSKKVIRLCTSIQDELTRSGSDMNKISKLESDIYKISDMINKIYNATRITKTEELIDATYALDEEINQFVK